MDKRRTIILLGVGAVISLMITLLIWGKMARRTLEPRGEIPKKEKVTVAAYDLAWGTVLKKELVKEAFFLKDSLPAGVFSDPNRLIGRVVLYPVKTGEPILESKLAPVTVASGGVAAVIGEGKRAMAVRVDKVIGVSGFIFPGHRIDVLVTLRDKDPEKESRSGPITKTVLQNIKVLATGTEMVAETKIGPGGKKRKKPCRWM
ncbi:MAG: Flp pilus assembly protein CpaB [bacterium]|nr:Flp pilus assembly protein CpaB [bacterium]